MTIDVNINPDHVEFRDNAPPEPAFKAAVRVFTVQPERVELQIRGHEPLGHGRKARNLRADASLTREQLDQVIANLLAARRDAFGGA